MRINTNISAMNTYGRLTNANAAKSDSLSKLSSGLRINKAGDDAAGLAISEKMKGQVGGLTQAVRNAQDGVSLIQTAEGALNETHAILGRMRDLAVQGANGTLSQDDRGEINKEFGALKEEITRISNTTEFNTKKLLNTENQEFTFQIGANGGQTMSVKIGKMDAESLKISNAALADVSDPSKDDTTQKALKVAKEALLGADGTGEKEGAKYEYDAAVKDLAEKQKAYDEAVAANVPADITAAETALETAKNTLNGDPADATDTGAKGAYDAAVKELADAEAAVDSAGRKSSSDAIASIDAAIATVSAQRSDLGAAQNRLSHTVKNLTTTKENLAEANSRIRDVDMAEEMMAFTKNNILSQAATSMLSQANAMPNSVLGLLQG